MTNTVLSPPIPPYQNLPIESQFYQPSQFFISAISLGTTTTVTTTVDMKLCDRTTSSTDYFHLNLELEN